jgi:hypothetical protein
MKSWTLMPGGGACGEAGAVIASAGNSVVQLWDTATGQPVRSDHISLPVAADRGCPTLNPYAHADDRMFRIHQLSRVNVDQ